MKYKTEKIFQEYHEKIHSYLKDMLILVEVFCRLRWDKGILVTSLLRPVGSHLSFHPISQAADIRTKDAYFSKDELLELEEFFTYMKKKTNGLFDFDMHWELYEKPHMHIHLEYDSKQLGVFPVKIDLEGMV